MPGSSLLTGGTFEQLKKQAGSRGFTYLGRYVPGGSQETAQQVQARLPASDVEDAASVKMGVGRAATAAEAEAWNQSILNAGNTLLGKSITADANVASTKIASELARRQFAEKGISEAMSSGVISGLTRKGPGLADAALSLDGIMNFVDEFVSNKTVGRLNQMMFNDLIRKDRPNRLKGYSDIQKEY